MAVPSPSILLMIVVYFISYPASTTMKITNMNKQMFLHKKMYNPYLDTMICNTTPGLTKSQKLLCYKKPDTTEVALKGLREAIKVCQKQFIGHRWNCSSVTKSQSPFTSPILYRGYVETAYLHAIYSAGVTIAVYKACSSGLLNCGCDNSVKSTYKWGGCLHNIKYGVRFSKRFLDCREKFSDMQSRMNLHNNKVGRLITSSNMKQVCKCHGVSGSCATKTCWNIPYDIKVIGSMLKQKYSDAIFVEQSNKSHKKIKQHNNHFRTNSTKHTRKKSKIREDKWMSRRVGKQKRNVSVHDLVFYQKSPDYCEPDNSIDYPGTIGRICNRTSVDSDSCSSLCCGRGYHLLLEKRREQCKCRFIHCCKVVCEICYREQISICK